MSARLHAADFAGTGHNPMAEKADKFFRRLQDEICAGLERLDSAGRFREDVWSYDQGGDTRGRSGGGRTRVIEGGALFEKGGVNVSSIRSPLSATIARKLGVDPQEAFATGISLVLHPLSPMVPTVHMNLRYFTLEHGRSWFGGGADMTPCYFFAEDARHFHRTLKSACDRFDPSSYERFKQSCDEYFYLPHRGEGRGIGGIFFDYLTEHQEQVFELITAIGGSFLPAYEPVARRRREERWGDKEKRWQELRRGRYVEFNLVYDRGTLFGLETGGRTESILMSLPPRVRWEYDVHPAPGSREQELLDILHQPRSWL